MAEWLCQCSTPIQVLLENKDLFYSQDLDVQEMSPLLYYCFVFIAQDILI